MGRRGGLVLYLEGLGEPVAQMDQTANVVPDKEMVSWEDSVQEGGRAQTARMLRVSFSQPTTMRLIGGVVVEEVAVVAVEGAVAAALLTKVLVGGLHVQGVVVWAMRAEEVEGVEGVEGVVQAAMAEGVPLDFSLSTTERAALL